MMDLSELQRHWDRFGVEDPFWAILTDPRYKGGRWDPVEFFETGRREIAGVLEVVKSLGRGFAATAAGLEQGNAGRALDFGCGVGRLTQALCEHFAECHGVDIAPSMIRMARQYNRHGDRCIYHLNSRADLKLLGSVAFDLIYSNIALQHIHPDFSRAYIAEFVRILAPGGVLIFQVPSERLVANASSTFSVRPLPQEGFRAKITSGTTSLAVEPGAAFSLPLRIRNQGAAPWPSGTAADGRYQIVAGNHWIARDGRMLVRDDKRQCLPKDIQPGEEFEISFPLTATLDSGEYFLEIDLVQEHVAWFADMGSMALRIPIRISGREPHVSQTATRGGTEGRSAAVMEMHGIERGAVVALLEEAGAQVLHIGDAPVPGWKSFRYFVTK